MMPGKMGLILHLTLHHQICDRLLASQGLVTGFHPPQLDTYGVTFIFAVQIQRAFVPTSLVFFY